eukprot:scaffold273557_cov30-Tisochrysis_lutea.AAC.1
MEWSARGRYQWQMAVALRALSLWQRLCLFVPCDGWAHPPSAYEHMTHGRLPVLRDAHRARLASCSSRRTLSSTPRRRWREVQVRRLSGRAQRCHGGRRDALALRWVS